jgi:hypothetical protein
MDLPTYISGTLLSSQPTHNQYMAKDIPSSHPPCLYKTDTTLAMYYLRRSVISSPWRNSDLTQRSSVLAGGWRDLGSTMGAIRRASMLIITVDPQFDLERYHDENISTRSAMGDSRPPSISTHSSSPVAAARDNGNPFGDVFAIKPQYDAEDKSDPFHDSHAVPPDVEASTEEPYHVFSRSKKWRLIIIIGIAGMFSGLSSNIFFPSLDAIAKASPRPQSLRHMVATSGLIDEIAGLQCQPRPGLPDDHVLSRHPGLLASDLGRTI